MARPLQVRIEVHRPGTFVINEIRRVDSNIIPAIEQTKWSRSSTITLVATEGNLLLLKDIRTDRLWLLRAEPTDGEKEYCGDDYGFLLRAENAAAIACGYSDHKDASAWIKKMGLKKAGGKKYWVQLDLVSLELETGVISSLVAVAPDTAAIVERIKEELRRLPPGELRELKRFIEELLEEQARDEAIAARL